MVAKDYNEAAKKAQFYLDTKLVEIAGNGVLEPDGSLSNNEQLNIKIVGVAHISNIIW